MSEILNARENRGKHIESLMKEFEYMTIAVLKLNVVGEDKNPEFMKFICLLFDRLIKQEFGKKIVESKRQFSLDGDYIYYVINEEGTVVKERTIEIEDNNYLGRLIDIDIYHKKSISRQDMSCEMRKCIICDNYAHVCSRNKTHSREDVSNKVSELIEEHLTEIILSEVMKSIYEELDLFPKFGLVSHRDNGCHTDMDYEMFVRSTFTLKPFIKKFILFGIQGKTDSSELIKIGQEAEQAMFKVTNGVNTQKGLIFVLGIFLPSLCKAIISNQGPEFVKEEIIKTSNEVIGDYFERIEEKDDLTHGDKVYLEHSLKGIRGEALLGFPLIFDIDDYDHIAEFFRPQEYLIELMSKLDDTTIVHRKGIETLQRVKREMTQLIMGGGYMKNTRRYKELSDIYKNDGISPGGSSDLLALKLVYEHLKFLICTTCIQ